MKKFDFVIGNPAYQESMEGTSDKPVYNYFLEESYKIGLNVEMITPARFLFNAGKTPKAWNEKMLSDPHLKVCFYEPDSSKVFSNTEIKGGVAITYHDCHKNFGAIETFTRFNELNNILKKVKERMTSSLADIVYAPESYRFSKTIHVEHPEIKRDELLSKGHDFDLTSNIFDKLENIVFFSDKPNNANEYVQILGRKNNERVLMWIDRRYIAHHDNLDKYKLFYPKSNGSGLFGETISPPAIGSIHIGHTQTFLSMGAFDTEYEAASAMKYVKTKFARAMLGVLKVTQDNKKSVWKFVPLQDFSANSDIDWSQPISGIDGQLYKKYGLTEEEISFIETHVKEMA